MLTSETKGETLTLNPNECHATLTSAIRGDMIYPYPYIHIYSLGIWYDFSTKQRCHILKAKLSSISASSSRRLVDLSRDSILERAIWVRTGKGWYPDICKWRAYDLDKAECMKTSKKETFEAYERNVEIIQHRIKPKKTQENVITNPGGAHSA